MLPIYNSPCCCDHKQQNFQFVVLFMRDYGLCSQLLSLKKVHVATYNTYKGLPIDLCGHYINPLGPVVVPQEVCISRRGMMEAIDAARREPMLNELHSGEKDFEFSEDDLRLRHTIHALVNTFLVFSDGSLKLCTLLFDRVQGAGKGVVHTTYREVDVFGLAPRRWIGGHYAAKKDSRQQGTTLVDVLCAVAPPPRGKQGPRKGPKHGPHHQRKFAHTNIVSQVRAVPVSKCSWHVESHLTLLLPLPLPTACCSPMHRTLPTADEILAVVHAEFHVQMGLQGRAVRIQCEFCSGQRLFIKFDQSREYSMCLPEDRIGSVANLGQKYSKINCVQGECETWGGGGYQVLPPC